MLHGSKLVPSGFKPGFGAFGRRLEALEVVNRYLEHQHRRIPGEASRSSGRTRANGLTLQLIELYNFVHGLETAPLHRAPALHSTNGQHIDLLAPWGAWDCFESNNNPMHSEAYTELDRGDKRMAQLWKYTASRSPIRTLSLPPSSLSPT